MGKNATKICNCNDAITMHDHLIQKFVLQFLSQTTTLSSVNVEIMQHNAFMQQLMPVSICMQYNKEKYIASQLNTGTIKLKEKSRHHPSVQKINTHAYVCSHISQPQYKHKNMDYPCTSINKQELVKSIGSLTTGETLQDKLNPDGISSAFQWI